MADLRAYARQAAQRAGIDPDLFERQIQQESGFNPQAFNAGSGASGVAQIIARFHPGVDPWNPEASLDYAASWMAKLRQQYGSYRKALAAYNWGPGNVAGWDGRRETLPAETRHYLDVILGPGWPEPGVAIVAALKLSDVLARAYSQVTNPPKPYVWGGKRPETSFDCSGLVAWAYGGKVTSFTDAILGETERVANPAPGDIVLYKYADSSQPGVKYPHVGIFLSDTETLDARFGVGVGVHPQLPRTMAQRWYRRLPGVVVDTVGAATPGPVPPTPPPATDPRDERIKGLVTAVAHLADVVVPKAAAAATEREAALSEAKAIREQFVGSHP